MKFLVTGTAGFIGFHFANRLLKEGHEVVGLDCINDYYDIRLKYGRLKVAGIDPDKTEYNKLITSSENPQYRFIKMHLEDKENLNRLFNEQHFERVCNLAAQAGVRYSLTNPQAYIDSNIVGFINILEACRHHSCQNLVYASSSSVYGSNTKMPFSEKDNVDHPISLYAASKKSNELMAHTYSHLFGIPTTGLRFFTVYGPWGRPDMALFIFTKAILEGKPIQVFNNGEMERDFTYVDDIIEGVYRVIMRITPEKPPFEVYNIGNSKPVKLTNFIEAIENTLGKKAKIEYLPMQAGDVAKTWADVSKLEKDTGYKPDCSVEEGIRRFVKWYREFYNL
jgi:UDP-glucuronate 4-epimerase